MKILYAKDYADMSRKAANIIAAQVTLNPKSVLGLATGSSPLGTYKELIARCKQGDLDFSDISAVNLDEYYGLRTDNDQSYAYFMHQNFFKDININPANTYIPDGMCTDQAAECIRYDKIIEDLGGADIQLLGVGHNGHIGFNEPATSFAKGVHCVDLTQTTIQANARFFATMEDVPKKAYSMGVKSIMSARMLLMIASGAEKAEILCKLVTGDIEPSVPASILQLHSNTIIVADEAALQVLAVQAPQLISRFPQ